MKIASLIHVAFFLVFVAFPAQAQVIKTGVTATDLRNNFLSPPMNASPWVFWYWMHGVVSKEGITADLEAMKQAGIGGAYLMPIKDTTTPSLMKDPVRQLSPQWWAMVTHSLNEARRLGLQLGMH